MVTVILYILTAIAILFFIFAMAAIILLARRIAILTDDLRSLIGSLKGKIPNTADKITETAEEARLFLNNLRKASDLVHLIQTLITSSKKFSYVAGAFLAGLRMGLKAFLKSKKKQRKEADECGREQG
ncbi:hypothetical protein H5T87_08090 [bacterium]|nr:hypothetical protein [bacterium]